MASFQRAEALGFTDAQDLEAFGMYAVTIHPTFDTHPIISDRLQGRTQGDYFSALVDDLSADQWAKIGADLSTSPSMQKDSSI
jgi:hypothetical protein